jgi:hypothetical protein
MAELSSEETAQLRRIRRAYSLMIAAVAVSAVVVFQFQNVWSLLCFAATLAVALYAYSLRCPRCGNVFFLGKTVNLLSPGCSFCGLPLRPPSSAAQP